MALDQKGNTLVLYNYVEKHGKPLYNLIKEKGYDISSKSQNQMLVSFTEMNSKEEIDNLINLLSKIK